MKWDREGSEDHVVVEGRTVLPVSRVTQVSQGHQDHRERSGFKDQKDHVASLDYPDRKATTGKMAHRERLASGDLRVKMVIQDQRAPPVSLDPRVKPENQDPLVNQGYRGYQECQVSREFLVIPARKVKLDLQVHLVKMDHLERKGCLVSRESVE